MLVYTLEIKNHNSEVKNILTLSAHTYLSWSTGYMKDCGLAKSAIKIFEITHRTTGFSVTYCIGLSLIFRLKRN